MRKLTYAINVTIDGCCDHTKAFADGELLEHYTELLRDVDLLVYGRKTYELMVPYWPEIAKNQSETKAYIEFARAFVSIKKVVFSRTLDSAEDISAQKLILEFPLRIVFPAQFYKCGKTTVAGVQLFWREGKQLSPVRTRMERYQFLFDHRQ